MGEVRKGLYYSKKKHFPIVLDNGFFSESDRISQVISNTVGSPFWWSLPFISLNNIYTGMTFERGSYVHRAYAEVGDGTVVPILKRLFNENGCVATCYKAFPEYLKHKCDQTPQYNVASLFEIGWSKFIDHYAADILDILGNEHFSYFQSCLSMWYPLDIYQVMDYTYCDADTITSYCEQKADIGDDHSRVIGYQDLMLHDGFTRPGRAMDVVSKQVIENSILTTHISNPLDRFNTQCCDPVELSAISSLTVCTGQRVVDKIHGIQFDKEDIFNDEFKHALPLNSVNSHVSSLSMSLLCQAFLNTKYTHMRIEIAMDRFDGSHDSLNITGFNSSTGEYLDEEYDTHLPLDYIRRAAKRFMLSTHYKTQEAVQIVEAVILLDSVENILAVRLTTIDNLHLYYHSDIYTSAIISTFGIVENVAFKKYFSRSNI